MSGWVYSNRSGGRVNLLPSLAPRLRPVSSWSHSTSADMKKVIALFSPPCQGGFGGISARGGCRVPENRREELRPENASGPGELGSTGPGL
jgi:hypothetical protein